jgi:hypothetical protein
MSIEYTGPYYPLPKPMTPQLYEHVDAKLQRIKESLYSTCWLALYPGAPPDVVRNAKAVQDAFKDIARCQRDLKYEYLGLKDSWL